MYLLGYMIFIAEKGEDLDLTKAGEAITKKFELGDVNKFTPEAIRTKIGDLGRAICNVSGLKFTKRIHDKRIDAVASKLSKENLDRLKCYLREIPHADLALPKLQVSQKPFRGSGGNEATASPLMRDCVIELH